MKTDKDIALELVDLIEEMHLREIVYKAVLETVTEYDWHQTLAKTEKNESYRKQIHEYFSPLRQQVLDAPDLTSAVRKMLEEFERTDPSDSGNQE